MRPHKLDVARNMLNGVTEVRFSFTGDPSEKDVTHLLNLQYGSDVTAQLKALARLCVSLIEAAEKDTIALQKLGDFAHKWLVDHDGQGGPVPQPPVQYPPGKRNG